MSVLKEMKGASLGRMISHVWVVWNCSGSEVQSQPGVVVGRCKVAHSGTQVLPLEPEVSPPVVVLVDAGDT